MWQDLQIGCFTTPEVFSCHEYGTDNRNMFLSEQGCIVFCAGKRIRLGRDRVEAEERYRQIIAELNL